MNRQLLPESNVHPAVREKRAGFHRDLIQEVQSAVERDDIVIVGMKQNPHPRRARKALRAKGLEHTYLEYGSYLKAWRPRLALKLWTGWPTFPMVFVKGTLVGGASDLERLIESGEIDELLNPSD